MKTNNELNVRDIGYVKGCGFQTFEILKILEQKLYVTSGMQKHPLEIHKERFILNISYDDGNYTPVKDRTKVNEYAKSMNF